MKMALASVLRQSRKFENSLRASLKPFESNGAQQITSYRLNNQEKGGSNEKSWNPGTNWGSTGILCITTGIAAAGLVVSGLQNDLLAEEPDELEQVMIKEIIDQENR